MAPRKHLVLDEDVHEALSHRREMTGLPISQIGNAIVRAHIAAPLLEHLIGEQLVKAGRVTEEEYAETLEQADRKLRKEFKAGAAPVQRVSPGRFTAGSWELLTVFESPVGAFQLVEVWARDALQRPFTQHMHDADEFLISIAGRCFVVMGGVPLTLTTGCVLRVPAGAAHSATPLDDQCHLLAVVTPAVPEYSTQATP